MGKSAGYVRSEHAQHHGERGQMLVLGILVIVVVMGFTALSVDVGFFLRHRAVVQQAVDAAALAGSQALPDDPVAAEQLARDYAEKNGIDPDTLDVSFRCTSEYQVACDPAAGKWDTIQVSGGLDVPFFFAPVLQVTQAGDSCWFDSCPVVETAAACRGLCGSSPTVPVDVVQILDRTGSMSGDDMQNAKKAAETLLETFNPDLHRVGLGVLGPGLSASNACQSGLPGEWLPVHLSDDYQNPGGQLNNGSRLVDTIHCLGTSSVGTDLGDPIRAAVAELQANGRPDTKWGIILLTDGAANTPMTDGETAWHDCSSQEPVTSGSGDNDGYEHQPDKACSDGNGQAEDMDSGTSTSTGCDSSGSDRHVFHDYGISLPSGYNVTGIGVRVDAKVSASGGTNQMCVQLSWDGGATWTDAKSTGDINNSWVSRNLGGDGDTWGHTWTPDELANGNFMIRVTDSAGSASRDFSLDWVTPKVYYDTGNGGPCEFAAQQADIAKALGIEVYAVGYGTEDNSDAGFLCGNDTGTWAGRTAEELLQYMATDDAHFFQEAQGEDLSPIFQIIAQDLAGGSRLVPIVGH
jgi:hypothetical protein